MWWIIVPLVIGALIIAEIIDRRQQYSPDKNVIPAPRVIHGAWGNNLLPHGYEFMFDDEPSDSGARFEALVDEMTERDSHSADA
ncbi:MAG: hypothetical protein AM324_014115 [Candidatus Thorarchaeota archaeon SMTZ1-83]|nr:MAG: hypothetical protein AM324_15240 [Candidatus Thorarchaeota archaeon SMTZ1-83]